MTDWLSALPPEILLLDLLLVLPTRDLLNLACTSKAGVYLFPYPSDDPQHTLVVRCTMRRRITMAQEITC